MIQALQGKIVDMEITIARMIKEKENLKQVGPSAVKPVVSLNRWLPESPVSCVSLMNHVAELILLSG